MILNLKKAFALFLAITFVCSAQSFVTIAAEETTTATPQSGLELTLTLTHGCYDSTGSSNIGTGTGIVSCFAATQIFTKEDLPNGTVITIDSGYKYRPEGWVSLDTKNESSARPGNVRGPSTIVVDDEWWGDFEYRAFNISNSEQTDLTDTYEEVGSHLKITLPVTWTHGCYSSTSSSDIYSSADIHKQFVASNIFTKAHLPNGTKIILDEGYKYRPEGWTALNEKTASDARPGYVYGPSEIIVDDEWWGDFNYRAFNVANSAQSDLTDTYLEAASHFRIVPPSAQDSGDSGDSDDTGDSGDTGGSGESGGSEDNTEEDDNIIKVLAIGNSYSNDAMHYAEQIAEAFGYQTEFLSLYYAGCKIHQHLEFYESGDTVYSLYDRHQAVRHNVSIKGILEEDTYDYITFQQGSWQSPTWSTYYTEENPYIVDLYNTVKQHQPDATYYIHQTWGYDPERSAQMNYATPADMFADVEECYNKASEILGGLPIIKSGKAVQIAKDNFHMKDTYGKTDSIYSDWMCHLTDRGDFIASCVWVETIFGVDVRTKDFTSIFADAPILCEIAHQAVNETVGAKITAEEIDLGTAAVIKSSEVDGFDYDGRAKITIYDRDRKVTLRTSFIDAGKAALSLDRLPAGSYDITVEKNGYITCTLENIAVSADTETKLENIALIPGDIKSDYADFSGDGKVDLRDFVRIIRGFTYSETAEYKQYSTVVDLSGDGVITVKDLDIIKQNFGKSTEDYKK